jgi:pimeloyl-ACP methyl ester carboxylesterase
MFWKTEFFISKPDILMDWTYKYHHVNGIQLHVGHMGMQHTKVIILLHGFPEFSGAWKKQAVFLSEKGFHVVAPDQRGYNLSSKPEHVKDYVLKNLANDIASLIQDITDKPVIVTGHDWGGVVAWTLAQHHSQLLDKLIILNMPHPHVMKQNLKTNPGQMLKSWYAAFFQLPSVPEFLGSLFQYKWLELSLKKTARAHTFSIAEIAAYKKAWSQPHAVHAMINWYRAFKLNTLNTDLDVMIPTLIIWGEKDSFLSSTMAQESIQRCKNGKLIKLDQATHWLHHEEPDKVNELMLDFCNVL